MSRRGPGPSIGNTGVQANRMALGGWRTSERSIKRVLPSVGDAGEAPDIVGYLPTDQGSMDWLDAAAVWPANLAVLSGYDSSQAGFTGLTWQGNAVAMTGSSGTNVVLSTTPSIQAQWFNRTPGPMWVQLRLNWTFGYTAYFWSTMPTGDKIRVSGTPAVEYDLPPSMVPETPSFTYPSPINNQTFSVTPYVAGGGTLQFSTTLPARGGWTWHQTLLVPYQHSTSDPVSSVRTPYITWGTTLAGLPTDNWSVTFTLESAEPGLATVQFFDQHFTNFPSSAWDLPGNSNKTQYVVGGPGLSFEVPVSGIVTGSTVSMPVSAAVMGQFTAGTYNGTQFQGVDASSNKRDVSISGLAFTRPS